MSKYLGRAFIRINGETLASMPGTAKMMPGGFERTPVVVDQGFVGYTEKPMHAEIECEIAVSGSTDIGAINKTVDASVTFEADSGQAWIMRNASLAMPAAVQSGEGKATLKYIGAVVEQT